MTAISTRDRRAFCKCYVRSVVESVSWRSYRHGRREETNRATLPLMQACAASLVRADRVDLQEPPAYDWKTGGEDLANGCQAMASKALPPGRIKQFCECFVLTTANSVPAAVFAGDTTVDDERRAQVVKKVTQACADYVLRQ